MLYIIVKDNGESIPHDIQPKVFDMFYRGSYASQGSGLGLYIVKNAVEKLGGTIRLESGKNKGTAFIIRFPIENMN